MKFSFLFRWLYSLAFYVLSPLIGAHLLWRSKDNPAYRQRFLERLGFLTKEQQQSRKSLKGTVLLFHCASVGEFLGARSFIEALLEKGYVLWITCTTPTGSALIQEFCQQHKGKCHHSYLPLDLPCSISRFLKEIQPAAVILMETELWPNVIHRCHKRNIPTLLVNARMSNKSMTGYLKVRWFFKDAWQALSYCGVQDAQQAKRFLKLGVRATALEVTGHLKFDVKIPEWILSAQAVIKPDLKKRLVFTAASTHEGEELLILKAFKKAQQKLPNILLILVPRHQERFESVAELIKEQGFNFDKRSVSNGLQLSIKPETEVFLADSMGELMLWYSLSDLCFIGGSLIERGGHNPLEALAFNKPILVGPYVFNFEKIYKELIEVGAAQRVTGELLSQSVLENFTDSKKYSAQAGQALFEAYHGATKKLLQAVEAQV